VCKLLTVLSVVHTVLKLQTCRLNLQLAYYIKVQSAVVLEMKIWDWVIFSNHPRCIL